MMFQVKYTPKKDVTAYEAARIVEIHSYFQKYSSFGGRDFSDKAWKVIEKYDLQRHFEKVPIEPKTYWFDRFFGFDRLSRL